MSHNYGLDKPSTFYALPHVTKNEEEDEGQDNEEQESPLYIPDMSIKNVLYMELCTDILKNQIYMLKSYMYLNNTNYINSFATESNLISRFRALCIDFDTEYRSVYISLDKQYKEELFKYSTTNIINLHRSAQNVPWLGDIVPDIVLNSKYTSPVGLGLAQRLAYPDCYVDNPWVKYNEYRYNFIDRANNYMFKYKHRSPCWFRFSPKIYLPR